MAAATTTSLKGQLALITGATAGIGLAIAEALAARGCDLIVTGRRQDRLDALVTRLKGECGVHVLPLKFDVSDRAATEQALNGISKELERLSILINNAGLAVGTDPMPKASLDDWETMIDTNIKGLLYVTRLCLPYLVRQSEQKNGARGSGHVVNIGSVAGRYVYPGGGVYCATKFAVRALTEGLRLDLLGTPVRVTNIEPGMVETEFSEVRFQGDKERAKNVYKGMQPLKAEDIAETVAWCLERPAHVNIQELLIYPTDQAAVGPYVNRRHEK